MRRARGPWAEPPEDIYTLTRAPQDCPDEPAYVEIEFEAGVPVRANGIDDAAARADREPRDDRRRARRRPDRHGREPADRHQVARGLRSAGRASCCTRRTASSRSSSSPRDLERLKHDLGRTYADLVYNGLWFSQTREAIDAFVRTIQPRVTGAVRLKLFKGDCRVVGRRSPFALYDQALATYDAGDAFDRSATEGFIKIWGCPSRRPPARRQSLVTVGALTWRTSGQDGSRAIPTPSCSRSAPRSGSIAGCSRTT